MGLCCSKFLLVETEHEESHDQSKGSVKLSGDVRNTMVQEATLQESKHHFTENLVLHEFDRDIHDFYEINNGTVLGAGISGSVKICIEKKTQTRYALKTLSKAKIISENLPQLRDEISIMASLDHPNILRVYECFETAEHIYIILDLCTGHDLLTCLNKQINIHYSEKKTGELVSMMLSALRYCHKHGIVHRDIKLENFLFESEKPNAALKMIDFGFSQHFNPNEVLHRDVGSPYYVAPEVLDKNYNEKCDIWSIGVVTYILLSGEPPYGGKGNVDVLRKVKNGPDPTYSLKVFHHVSKEAIDFMKKCLNRNVWKRLSADEASQHPWFQSLHNSDSPPSAVSSEVVTSLRQFSNRSRLSRVCLEVVAHVLNNDQIEDLRAEFSKVDNDGNGEINFNDLRLVLRAQSSVSEEDILHVFDDLDVDHTGVIHYHEFLAAAVNLQEITETNMKLAFDKLSHHHDFITASDIQRLLGKDSNLEEVNNMMVEAGVAPDKNIYYDDFKSIMRGGRSRAAASSPIMNHTVLHRIKFFHCPTRTPSSTLDGKVLISVSSTDSQRGTSRVREDPGQSPLSSTILKSQSVP